MSGLTEREIDSLSTNTCVRVVLDCFVRNIQDTAFAVTPEGRVLGCLTTAGPNPLKPVKVTVRSEDDEKETLWGSTCPTCTAPVRVVDAGEGATRYVPDGWPDASCPVCGVYGLHHKPEPCVSRTCKECGGTMRAWLRCENVACQDEALLTGAVPSKPSGYPEGCSCWRHPHLPGDCDLSGAPHGPIADAVRRALLFAPVSNEEWAERQPAESLRMRAALLRGTSEARMAGSWAGRNAGSEQGAHDRVMAEVKRLNDEADKLDRERLEGHRVTLAAAHEEARRALAEAEQGRRDGAHARLALSLVIAGTPIDEAVRTCGLDVHSLRQTQTTNTKSPEPEPTDTERALHVLPAQLEGPFWDDVRKRLATEMFRCRIHERAKQNAHTNVGKPSDDER